MLITGYIVYYNDSPGGVWEILLRLARLATLAIYNARYESYLCIIGLYV